LYSGTLHIKGRVPDGDDILYLGKMENLILLT